MNNIVPPITNSGLIDLFSKSNLLTDKDIKNLEDAKNFIVQTYTSVPMYRPLAIKLLGVLSHTEHPTNESKLWQCRVEAEVHANELVRDIHDLEKLKIQIERNDYLLSHVMQPKFNTLDEKHLKVELQFDMRLLSVTISQQKFELLQLQKRIKYRIEEVHEWKVISEKLIEAGTTDGNYGEMLLKNLRTKLENDLNNPLIDDEAKILIKAKLASINVRSQL